MTLFNCLPCARVATAVSYAEGDNVSSWKQAKYSVGIDMGAARSGYAFVNLKGDNTEVHQVADYFPGTQGGGNFADTSTAKTMTAILYKKHLLGNWEPVDWGWRAYTTYQNMPMSTRCNFELFEDFKMALANEDERRRFGLQMRPGCNLSLERIIADFLTFVSKHAVQSLGKHYNDRNAVAADVLWTITVPANWSPAAQEVMRQAAVQAGMVATPEDHRLEVITEPEAAAQSCLHRGLVHTGGPGATFMVVDAGGSTTDVTVHPISEDGHLEDAIYACGIVSGSKHIDRMFEEWLAGLLGKEVIHDWKRDDPAAYLELMHGVWALAKLDYKGDSDDTTYVINLDDARLANRVPEATKEDLVARRILGGYLRNAIIMGKAEISAFFAGAIKNALALVQKSVGEAGQTPKMILLVGGLGSSPYMLQELKALVHQEQWGTEVITPSHGLAAVVQGASLFQRLNDPGEYKKAGYGYGLWLPLSLHEQEQLYAGTSHETRPNMSWRPMITAGEYVQVHMKPKLFTTAHLHTTAGSTAAASLRVYRTADMNPVYGSTTQGECIGVLQLELPAGQTGVGGGQAAFEVLQLWYRLGKTRVTVLAKTSTCCTGHFVFSFT